MTDLPYFKLHTETVTADDIAIMFSTHAAGHPLFSRVTDKEFLPEHFIIAAMTETIEAHMRANSDHAHSIVSRIKQMRFWRILQPETKFRVRAFLTTAAANRTAEYYVSVDTGDHKNPFASAYIKAVFGAGSSDFTNRLLATAKPRKKDADRNS